MISWIVFSVNKYSRESEIRLGLYLSSALAGAILEVSPRINLDFLRKASPEGNACFRPPNNLVACDLKTPLTKVLWQDLELGYSGRGAELVDGAFQCRKIWKLAFGESKSNEKLETVTSPR